MRKSCIGPQSAPQTGQSGLHGPRGLTSPQPPPPGTGGTLLSAAFAVPHPARPRALGVQVHAGGPEGSEPACAPASPSLYRARRSGGLIRAAAPAPGPRHAAPSAAAPHAASPPRSRTITNQRGAPRAAGPACRACAVRLGAPGRPPACPPVPARPGSGWGARGRAGQGRGPSGRGARRLVGDSGFEARRAPAPL